MQGFTLTAITDAENNKLRRNFNVKINKVNGSWKNRSRALGQGACLKGMSRVKINKVNGPWKYRSRAVGQDACLKGMSRKITMKDLSLAAITDVEETKLRRKC